MNRKVERALATCKCQPWFFNVTGSTDLATCSTFGQICFSQEFSKGLAHEDGDDVCPLACEVLNDKKNQLNLSTLNPHNQDVYYTARISKRSDLKSANKWYQKSVVKDGTIRFYKDTPDRVLFNYTNHEEFKLAPVAQDLLIE